LTVNTFINQKRDSFVWFAKIPTRWIDVDVYGHVNNVQYYSYFDTAVAEHLIRCGGLEPQKSSIIGLVVETKCTFLKSIPFPAVVNAGLRVTRIGTTSVTYDIGLFVNDEVVPAATGYFVHVYVDRSTQAPTSIPSERRDALQKLLVRN
jgi:acyl-CoA thioester hydrolase